MAFKRAHLIISGRVQGVFYRANMRDQAELIGVKGWVKNNSDGTVEAVVEGEEEKVSKIISWCRKGPPLAYVKNVDLSWEDYKGEFERFSVTY